ncbi:unnamed protein product [Agarophyton chilense]
MKSCFVSDAVLPISGDQQQFIHKLGDFVRLPTCDWTLYNVRSDSEDVRNIFIAVMCRLAEVKESTVRTIWKNPSQYVLCYKHLNHSKHARNYAKNAAEVKGDDVRGKCFFKDCGCSEVLTSRRSRLWRVPVIQPHSLEAVNSFAQLDENIQTYSGGKLRAVDVMGKYSCSSCLYVVTEGIIGAVPELSLQNISSIADRIVLRFILYSLQSTVSEKSLPSFNVSSHDDGCDVIELAKMLRSSFLTPETNGDDLRLLPFAEISRSRSILCNLGKMKPWAPSISTIDDRTLERRVKMVLTGKGIILKKLYHKLRCYVTVDIVEKLLTETARSPTGR